MPGPFVQKVRYFLRAVSTIFSKLNDALCDKLFAVGIKDNGDWQAGLRWLAIFFHGCFVVTIVHVNQHHDVISLNFFVNSSVCIE